MRLGFVVIALIFLASGEVLSATGPKISVAASANTPLQIRDELNDSSKKRFLRSKETTGDEEERKFQVQGLQKIIKKQQALSKALSKKFTEKELVVFKEWFSLS
ncbi:hypothetical protein BBJ29_001991 [Phytophthora kernoviae]|uniref:RxLR effector protein n=1 Tax=Phytophthora kernoviae TaxID=325452 RepID=A0A3F2RRF5_9STRA|nr:hypothetical protein BBP00_00004579 [Phytophthora kernoviae]RLN67587.1 hypothetical protein BBJ29_001991 [Phytophthora kernoviae]